MLSHLYDIDRPDIKDAKFSLVCRYEAESDSPSGKARDLSFVNMCLWLAKRTSLSFSFVFYLSEESAKTRRMIFSKYPPFSSSITESPSYTEDEVNLAIKLYTTFGKIIADKSVHSAIVSLHPALQQDTPAARYTLIWTGLESLFASLEPAA